MRVLKNSRRPQQSRLLLVRTRKGQCSRPQDVPMGVMSVTRPSLTLEDGFVGDELTIVPPRRAHRRGKETRRVSKPNSNGTELQLATGLLPMPLLRNDNQKTTMKPRNRSSASPVFWECRRGSATSAVALVQFKWTQRGPMRGKRV